MQNIFVLLFNNFSLQDKYKGTEDLGQMLNSVIVKGRTDTKKNRNQNEFQGKQAIKKIFLKKILFDKN